MGVTVVASGGNVNVTTSDSTVNISTSISAVLAVDDWDALAALIGRGYNYPQPTGQTTVYRTGDDADIEATVFAPIRAVNSSKAQNALVSGSFDVLVNNNVFGNKNRFTDSEGGQDYDGTGGSLTDYVVDNYTGLGITRLSQSAASWNDAIDNSVASFFAGFSDWFLGNFNQYTSIYQFGNSSDIGYSYSPFSITVTFTHQISTTDPSPTTNCIITRGTWDSFPVGAKTTSRRYLMFRKHF